MFSFTQKLVFCNSQSKDLKRIARVALCKIEPKTVVLLNLVVSWKSTFYPRYKVVTEMGRSLFLKAGTSIRFGEALDGQRCKILIRISSAALNT